jgi:Tol biopolymer transport system component
LALGVTGWFSIGRTRRTLELKPTRITANPAERSINSAVISPDGRFLAYTDPTGIRLMTLQTKETRLLPATENMTLWGWTPAADKLIAIRQEAGSYPKAFYVSLIGGPGVQPAPWAVPSPDGTHMLAFKEGGAMWLQDAAGADKRLIAERVQPFAWSPDGKRLAYTKREDHAFSIRILEVATLAERMAGPAVSEPIVSLEFMNDGRIVYSKREPPPDDSGSNLWQVAPGDAAPAKLTQWEDFLVTALSATADGKQMIAIRIAAQSDVYVADLVTPDTLRGEPRRFTLDERNDSPAGWTRDSKSILFASDRAGSWDIYRQALDADTPEILASGPERQTLPRVTADGETVLFAARPADKLFGDARVMRVPIAGGVPQEVAKISNHHNHRCSSRCIVEEQHDGTLIAYELDPQNGKGRALLKREGFSGMLAISPDGKVGAWIPHGKGGPENKIRIADLDTGSVVRDIPVPAARFLTSLEWQPDGKGFYAGATIVSTGAILLHVDMTGKAAELWRQPGTARIWALPSPDSKHLAIYGATRDSNVWFIENP